jgi:hypothetical protein
LCISTVTELESGLARQRESDDAESRHLQQEERTKEEIARIGAEHEERELQELLKKLEQDRLHIEEMERDLEAQKQALEYAQNIGDDLYDDDDDDDDEGNVSTPTVTMVRRISIFSINSRVIIVQLIR